jgi:hypothetical protein
LEEKAYGSVGEAARCDEGKGGNYLEVEVLTMTSEMKRANVRRIIEGNIRLRLEDEG